MKSAFRTILPLAILLAAVLASAGPAHALRLDFERSGDSDKLTFIFNSGVIPSTNITRTGKEEITVPLPANFWFSETRPDTSTYNGSLINGVEFLDGAVKITTRSAAFGYVRIPDPENTRFVLQVFRDPYGSRWEPPTQAPTEPAQTQAPAQPQAAAQPAQPAPAPAPQQAQQPAATPDNAPPPAIANGDQQADLANNNEPRPFFEPSYAVRSQVTPPGQDAANTTARAEQAPAAATPAPQAEPTPMDGQTGGAVSGVVRRRITPPGQEPVPVSSPDVAEQPAPPQPAQPQDGLGTDIVQTPEERKGAAAAAAKGLEEFFPKEVTTGDTASQFARRFQVVHKNADEVLRADMARRAQNGAPPNPALAEQPSDENGTTVAEQPAPDAQAPANEGGQRVQVKLRTSGETGPDGMPVVIEGSPPPPPQPGEENLVADITAGNQTAEPAPAPTEQVAEPAPAPPATPEDAEAEAQRQQLEEILRQAQSMMFQGDFNAALPLLEMLLKQPNLEQNIREEALYAIADIKKQLYADDIINHFDEIRTAYEQAMNANLKSERIPSALVGLGLINLQVGNFPEARAYFDLLRKNYPDDQNVPSISFYWGKYYYDKGDYAKAADQFQYLIQSYPEHHLVKQGAYYLADSLNRLGYDEQAYQIIDYMDKRWPDYHMENRDFLRLAGDVEQKLDMYDKAKDHYLTFYNLDPEGQGADVVLTRVGDIYLRDKLTDPARIIYEKVVRDFPDGEGALVGKMRLAEEGVYDDPSFVQMSNVFDRPYTLRPLDIYKEIVDKHPESPLAPVAELKMAMWYTFHEQYPEALAAAQDLIEKFPDSPLVERARELGDRVFVQAVPGLMQEERYDRVVRYWEGYKFIGEKDNTKVDDTTRLRVATSYWKIGQPEKALAIIQPYLDAPQKTDVSETALSLAVNIYLDQLAWNEIADTVRKAKLKWKLSDRINRQMDYARAMSLQNMGENDKALTLWADLARDVNVDPAFRAYAMYYMAQNANEKKDLRRLFVYAQEALTLLLQTKGDPEKIKDMVLLSIHATEQSGRYREALKWAREYDKYVTVDNPEWASTRFKLASIYRKAGAINEWRSLLQDIIDKKPGTLQAQLAKSSLETYDLEQKAQEYVPR